MKRRVSSSTQNQAFNALLFLFREVLKTELGDLSKTVRAKRGEKLPVVLSPEEIQALFKHIKGLSLLILQLLWLRAPSFGACPFESERYRFRPTPDFCQRK
jgi:integrase